MSWTFEYWKSGKVVAHRDKKGRFAKGHRHFSLLWKEHHREATQSKEFKEKQSKAIRLGHPLSEQTKRKLSRALKNNKNSLGHHHTEETKKKISESLKGHKSTLGMTGKHHSKETKDKISEALKGRSLSKEWRKKISETKRKK